MPCPRSPGRRARRSFRRPSLRLSSRDPKSSRFAPCQGVMPWTLDVELRESTRNACGSRRELDRGFCVAGDARSQLLAAAVPRARAASSASVAISSGTSMMRARVASVRSAMNAVYAATSSSASSTSLRTRACARSTAVVVAGEPCRKLGECGAERAGQRGGRTARRSGRARAERGEELTDRLLVQHAPPDAGRSRRSRRAAACRRG